jgi:23S rRNA pseudouridine1911/1915/1917 synthase
MQKKIIYEKFERERADSYLASIYKDYSRSYFQKLMDRKRVFANDKIISASHKLKRGDIITVEFEKKNFI